MRPGLRNIVENVAERVAGAARRAEPSEPDGRHSDLIEPDFLAAMDHCRPFTMTSVERMYALYQAVHHVCRSQIDGDIVECGVWRGGSAMLAAKTLLTLGDVGRGLWLFDTFEGMPPPGVHDTHRDGERLQETWHRYEGDHRSDWFAYASLDDARANIRTVGYPEEAVHLVRGRVEDTIPDAAPDRIAILRLDTDWYASTKHELEHLYPRLVPSGVLIIDDYGWWDGARRAVDEWLATVAHPPLLIRVDDTGRVGVRPGA